MKNFTRILCLALVSVLLVCTLASCAPNKDPKKAAASLKDAEYSVSEDVVVNGTGAVDAIAGLFGVKTETKPEGLEHDVVASKKVDDKTIGVAIYYFDSAKNAKTYFENAKHDDAVYKRSGKIVYWGDKDAVKAAG